MGTGHDPKARCFLFNEIGGYFRRREEKINQFMSLLLGNTVRQTKGEEIETALPEETIPMKLTWHGHSVISHRGGRGQDFDRSVSVR